jgi:hypothetical protein
MFQIIGKFLESKVNLISVRYYYHLGNIHISIGDGNNRAIIISFYPGSTPFTMGNSGVNVIERRPKEEVLLKWMAPIPARSNSSCPNGLGTTSRVAAGNHRCQIATPMRMRPPIYTPTTRQVHALARPLILFPLQLKTASRNLAGGISLIFSAMRTIGQCLRALFAMGVSMLYFQ